MPNSAARIARTPTRSSSSPRMNMGAGYRSRGACPSSTSSSATAPALSSGLFWLPHLGDWMHDGQPSVHTQAAMASRVAVSHARAPREAALGEPGAARVAVVDEDGELAGVGVQGGRDAADVPAVAGGEQRQQADRAVLRGVGRAGQVAGREPRLGEGVLGHRPPDRAGAQRALGKVERLLADDLARWAAGAAGTTRPGGSRRPRPSRAGTRPRRRARARRRP